MFQNWIFQVLLEMDLFQFESLKCPVDGFVPVSSTSSYSRDNKEQLEKLYKTLFVNQGCGHYWQTFMTNTMVKAHINATDAQKYKHNTSGPETVKDPFPTNPVRSQFEDWKKKFTDPRDSNFLFATYHPENIPDIIKTMRDNNFSLETGKNDLYGHYQAQYTGNRYTLFTAGSIIGGLCGGSLAFWRVGQRTAGVGG